MPWRLSFLPVPVLVWLLAWTSLSPGAVPLRIQGLIRDRNSGVPLSGVVISADPVLARSPATSRPDGQFDLELTDTVTKGSIITVYVRKPKYDTGIIVCPVVDGYLCVIEISALPPPVTKAEIKRPQSPHNASDPTHTASFGVQNAPDPTHTASTGLQIQLADINFEELHVSLVSSGKGRFIIDRLFLKLRGFADCTLSKSMGFAPLLGTPAYWMDLSDDASEYDLFPQDAPGELKTWQYVGDDVGAFSIKLTGRINRLHVLSMEVDARDVNGNKKVHLSSPLFQYFYKTDGVSIGCMDLGTWYRPNLLKIPRQQRYAGALDLFGYQLLTANLKYARNLLARASDADLIQELPELKRLADFWLNNRAFSENVRTIATYLENKGKLSYGTSLFYQYGRIPSGAILADLNPNERVWIDRYSRGFVYKRLHAIELFRALSQDDYPPPNGANWRETASLYDDAIAAAERSIIENTEDAPLAKSDLGDLLYDSACSWSRAAEVDRSASRLRRAIENGFRSVEHMKADPALETLRTRNSKVFNELVERALQEPGTFKSSLR